MNTKIEKEVLNILMSDELKVFHLMKIPEISDELYDKLVLSISSIGGTWSERHKGFIFKNNPMEKIQDLIKEESFDLSEEKIWKEKVQFYPTPADIVEKMINLANIQKGDVVLEPSAGQGAILDKIPSFAKTIAVELDEKNIKVLKNKGYSVYWGDFLEMDNFEITKVIMNPPFSRFQDIQHIAHAFKMLKKGGCLVAIMNENTLIRGEKNSYVKELLKVITDNKHEIIHLPEGSFEESGTMINTVLVKIEKGEN